MQHCTFQPSFPQAALGFFFQTTSEEDFVFSCRALICTDCRKAVWGCLAWQAWAPCSQQDPIPPSTVRCRGPTLMHLFGLFVHWANWLCPMVRMGFWAIGSGGEFFWEWGRHMPSLGSMGSLAARWPHIHSSLAGMFADCLGECIHRIPGPKLSPLSKCWLSSVHFQLSAEQSSDSSTVRHAAPRHPPPLPKPGGANGNPQEQKQFL